jgi:Uma2 family endonuclease
MTADEFLAWDRRQRKEAGRFELIDGHVVTLQSERVRHVTTKQAIFQALTEGLSKRSTRCVALIYGPSVRITRSKVYKPDGLIHCGDPLDPDQVEISDPMLVVEVLSPDSVERDHGEKVEGYFSLASVQHYLIVDPVRRIVVHHRRGVESDLLTNIRKSGTMKFEPPGVEIQVARFFSR